MIRPYDYELACQWWDTRGFPRIALEILPKTGWAIYVEGVPCLQGWLYVPEGDPPPRIGMFMWPVSNPEATSAQRAKAWDELMLHVDEVARGRGLWMIFTGTAHQPLIKRMETHGYVSYEDGSANMVKKIQ